MKPGSIRIVKPSYGGKELVVTCLPHVAIKLRRLFAGSQRTRDAGSFTLSATPTNAYELDWFRSRYPLDVESDSTKDWRQLLRIEKKKLAAIAKIEADDYVPTEFDLAIPARHYQRVAADLAIRTRRLLLADDIGTGKSVSCLCMLTAPGALPAAIVTMTQLPEQWEALIKRFAPGLVVHRIRSGQPYVFGDKGEMVMGEDGKRHRVKFPAKPDIVILSYSKLDGWADTLAGMVSSVIFDEAQELRHCGTDRYRAAQVLANACDLRCSNTATPVYNYGPEIFSVINVIAPDALGSRKEFFDEWCGGGGDLSGREGNKIRVADPAALGTYLRESGLMLRRTRKEVGRELPPLTIVRHVVACDPAHLDRVSSDVRELAERVLARIGTPLERAHYAQDLDWRMRQATGIGKAPATADFVRLLVEAEEPVLLFGWHREWYSVISSMFSREGHEIPHAMYTGEETSKEKLRSIGRFIDGEVKVLMMSNRAGQGVDGLQKVCRTVVVGELDWSPKVHEQNIGRVFRDGQADPVMAYYLITEEGSDPVIADVLGIKESQARGINDPGDTSVAHLVGASDDHIRRLAEYVLRRVGERETRVDAAESVDQSMTG